MSFVINPYRFGGGAPATQYSRDFNGTDDYVSIPDFAHDVGNLSCMCWVKTLDTNFASFFSHWDVSSQRGWIISTDTNDNLLCGISGNGTTSNRIFYTQNDAIADGTWRHVGFTFATSSLLKLYIDGTEITDLGNLGLATVGSIHNSTSDLAIGARFGSGTAAAFGDASIADCRIYDETLTEANMTTIATGGTYSDTNLVGRWITGDDEGSGSVTVVDQSTNSNDGTSVGSLSVADYPPI